MGASRGADAAASGPLTLATTATKTPRDWPQSALLLPTFVPVDGGSVILMNSTVEVKSAGAEAATLNALGRLGPQYGGGGKPTDAST